MGGLFGVLLGLSFVAGDLDDPLAHPPSPNAWAWRLGAGIVLGLAAGTGVGYWANRRRKGRERVGRNPSS